MAKRIDLNLEELLNGTSFKGGNPTVGVAVSGGRDSVALLHYLKTHGVRIAAVNVEHGIRGEESVRDSEFVARICNDLGVKLYAFSVDAPQFAKDNGYTVEQAARILRYRIFDGLLDGGECDLIALAHHRDDQIETVLMRILRGTGIRGLCGMKSVNGRYIRPFLNVSREDIDSYVADNGLEYVDDSTNGDCAYTRNFLRREIAVLKQRFPSMDETVSRLARNAAEADAFIQSQLPEIEVKHAQAYIKTSDCANTFIAKQLITKAANALGVTQDIEDRHYNCALALLNTENGKFVMLTHGLRVHRQDGYLVLDLNREEETPEREIAFCEGEFADRGICVVQIGVAEADFKRANAFTLFADADKIPETAVIRCRRNGDYINKFGGGTKSLGDFLTDKKVPLRLRDSLSVIADGSRILAVFGIDVSSDVKIDGGTKRVFALSLNRPLN